MKLDVPLPETGLRQLVQKNQFQFMHDFRFAMAKTKYIKSQRLDQIF